MPELIEVSETDGLRIALVYATSDNLAGRSVYASGARCALRPAAADCLHRAVRAARRAGLGLLVYDAYRPAAAQAVFWRMLPDPRYVADAALGSNHTRGVAVDVTLIDAGGEPLDLGTGFDDMRDQAHHDRDDLPPAVQRNRHMLLGIMLQAGFCSIPTEWWHYELPNAQEYALLPENDMVRVVPGLKNGGNMQSRIRMGIGRALMAAVVGAGAWALAGGALAATPADTLVIGKPADPQTLDPAVTIDNNDWTVTYPAYQRLMRYKQVDGQGSTEVEGDLAASWTASPDNLVWTFKLQDGQQFSDGTPVDAQAVKQSFERLLAKKQGPSEAFPADMKIDAPDVQTVQFTLQKPFAPFLYTLANNGASIVNPKAMQRDDADAWLAGNTAGSGPYQLVSWQKGQSLLLERNPHYAGSKKPTLEKLVVKIVPESSARRLQLQKGDLDVAEELPVDQLQALKKDAAVQVAEFPSPRVTYLYLNNAQGPLQNADLRRAVVAALDYQGIVDGIMMGQAKQMRGPIPEGMWGHDTTLPQPQQDAAAAKALVEKAGGIKSPLLLRYSTQDPAWEPIALTVQANLAAIGVPVKLEKLANATLRENLDQGNFDISIGNWSPDFADPYMFTSYWFDSDKKGLAGNRSFYANPQVDQWLREAATLSDQDQRVALYKQVQEQVVQDAAYAYLYQKNYQAGLGAGVKGFIFNPMLERVFNVADMTK